MKYEKISSVTYNTEYLGLLENYPYFPDFNQHSIFFYFGIYIYIYILTCICI